MLQHASASIDNFGKFKEHIKNSRNILLTAAGIGVDVPITKKTALDLKDWLSDEAVIHYYVDTDTKKLTITHIL